MDKLLTNQQDSLCLCVISQILVKATQLLLLYRGVTYYGWRHASKDFMSWAHKLFKTHQHIWRKAGIFKEKTLYLVSTLFSINLFELEY